NGPASPNAVFRSKPVGHFLDQLLTRAVRPIRVRENTPHPPLQLEPIILKRLDLQLNAMNEVDGFFQCVPRFPHIEVQIECNRMGHTSARYRKKKTAAHRPDGVRPRILY